MLVLKFGGTSVESAQKIDNALDIALSRIENGAVLVSSAMGKTTNKIIESYEYAEATELEKAISVMEEIKDLHIKSAESFLTGDNQTATITKLETIFTQFKSLLKGISLLRECSLRSMDTMLSFGERLSTTIIAARAIERGINAEWVDARTFMKSDDNFGSADILFDKTNKEIKDKIKLNKNKLVITQGFIASDPMGVTTTLGRGGSDYSASIIAAALNSEKLEIWTDVNGIMTSDPRSVTGVRTVDKITYQEAGELAYFGAKVVHPATIQPAVRSLIPVYVKNSGEPDNAGTLICEKTGKEGIKAISCKKHVTLINITSSRMFNAYGFLQSIFTVFAKNKTSVDLISTSEVSVSITIDNTDSIAEIEAGLKELGNVVIEEDKSIISLVGEQIWKDPSFTARTFAALTETPIRMISLGSSDINLSIVVPTSEADKTVQTLHSTFF